VPLPVPGCLQRVHREHLVPGGDQRRDPRAPVGLDPDHHLRVITSSDRNRPTSACNCVIPATPSGSRLDDPFASHVAPMLLTVMCGFDRRVEAELPFDRRSDVLRLAHLPESFAGRLRVATRLPVDVTGSPGRSR
jgi:hypothetical protein